MFSTSYDDSLDRCLERLEAGDTIESCLFDYPKHAYELREALEMAQQLQQLPLQRPSFAADIHFQQELRQVNLDPAPKQKWWLNVQLENPFQNIRMALLELSVLTLILISIAFVLNIQSMPPSLESMAISPEETLLTRQDLENLTYHAALVGSIQLKNGSYPLVSTDYSGVPHQIELGEQIAFGDLNGDTAKDAAALLYWRDQSKIPLWSLVIVQNNGESAKNVASTFIGPNLTVSSLEIIEHRVHITVLDKFGTSFTKIYRLDQSELILVDESIDFKPRSEPQNDQVSLLNSPISDATNEIIKSNRLSYLSYPLRGRNVVFKDGIVHGEYFSSRLLDSITLNTEPADPESSQVIVAFLTESTSNESVYFLSVVIDTGAVAVPITSRPNNKGEVVPFISQSLADHLVLDSIQLDGEGFIVELKTNSKDNGLSELDLKTVYSFKLNPNGVALESEE